MSRFLVCLENEHSVKTCRSPFFDRAELLDKTPRSPNSFMFACCAALDIDKSVRHVLGRWIETNPDRYITLERIVVQKLQGRRDSLGETEWKLGLEIFDQKRELDLALTSQQLFRLERSSVARASVPNDQFARGRGVCENGSRSRHPGRTS